MLRQRLHRRRLLPARKEETPFEHQDEDVVYEYQQDIYDLLDKYDQLEGESYYVILEEDLEG